jgi:hypothetical protein
MWDKIRSDRKLWTAKNRVDQQGENLMKKVVIASLRVTGAILDRRR